MESPGFRAPRPANLRKGLGRSWPGGLATQHHQAGDGRTPGASEVEPGRKRAARPVTGGPLRAPRPGAIEERGVTDLPAAEVEDPEIPVRSPAEREAHGASARQRVRTRAQRPEARRAHHT